MARTLREEQERLINDYKGECGVIGFRGCVTKEIRALSKDEDEALCRASEDAHLRNEQARLAFERHCQHHKC